MVAGDSLWAICKKFYGDGSLAYKLAAANGIINPSLIYPGQVLTIPALSDLPAVGIEAKVTETVEETTGAAISAARTAMGLASPLVSVRS